jgi:hypothetical protein
MGGVVEVQRAKCMERGSERNLRKRTAHNRSKRGGALRLPDQSQVRSFRDQGLDNFC